MVPDSDGEWLSRDDVELLQDNHRQDLIQLQAGSEKVSNAQGILTGRCAALEVEADFFKTSAEQLQSELTKARELLKDIRGANAAYTLQKIDIFLAHQSATAAKGGERYECTDKGGDYEVVAIAQGAGTLKGFSHYVYKNADGVHFVREPDDFLLRMQVKP